MRPVNARHYQQGVAIITALLLTTLAVTIVASLFWRQQIQVRAIENQRLQLQKQLALRGALDWAQLMLRDDARQSATDDLSELWNAPLAGVQLDAFLDRDIEQANLGDATLSGNLSDAQARFNLRNLAHEGKVNTAEVRVFQRLLILLRQDPALAMAAARFIASSQQAQAPPMLDLVYVEDLLTIPGFSEATITALRRYVVILPRATGINVNTAPAEVLAARLDTLNSSDITALVASRRIASFRDLNDFATRLPNRQITLAEGAVSVATDYFIADGAVAIDHATLQIQGLIERSGPNTRMVWVRER
jgi:general secretion pathway protein K